VDIDGIQAHGIPCDAGRIVSAVTDAFKVSGLQISQS